MNDPVKPIRVMLADHHKLVRAGIRALLEKCRKRKWWAKPAMAAGRSFDGEMPHG
jgi:hypothetical protein